MIDDYIEMPAGIAPIMDNWLRWVRDHAKSPVKCRSLESRWKSPQVWQGLRPKGEIDLFDALSVEKIVCQLPKKHKAAIKAWHVQKMPPHVMRRKIGTQDIRQLMHQAWQMIINRLTQIKNAGILEHETTVTVIDETAAIRRRI